MGSVDLRRRVFQTVLALAGCLCLALLSAGHGLAAPAPGGQGYAALGDSYVAGPGIPRTSGMPVGCLRSTNNYPSLVRAGLGAPAFSDVSCSGATTANITGAQTTVTGPNPPQVNAVSASTTLVTLGIGGNDIGFSEIVSQCLSQSRTEPNGAACKAYYTASGSDALAARIASAGPKVGRVLERIRQRAPRARVLLVGYPTILAPGGAGCPEAPFSAGDTAYLYQTFQKLNSMLQRQAQAAGAQYVDTAASSMGHDICQPPGTRWIEGRAPTSPAIPFHPNALSMRNTANQVLAAVKSAP
jgi:lysophospholipase L1-like esterase